LSALEGFGRSHPANRCNRKAGEISLSGMIPRRWVPAQRAVLTALWGSILFVNYHGAAPAGLPRDSSACCAQQWRFSFLCLAHSPSLRYRVPCWNITWRMVKYLVPSIADCWSLLLVSGHFVLEISYLRPNCPKHTSSAYIRHRHCLPDAESRAAGHDRTRISISSLMLGRIVQLHAGVFRRNNRTSWTTCNL
jgi:hypothetical protein